MKNFIKSFYTNNFIYKGKEKLSKLTILAIIVLDIFILSTLFQGIDFQTQVINNPSTKYPYECRDVLNINSKVDDFNNYLYNKYNYDNRYQNIEDLEVDSRCSDILNKINFIRNEIDIDGIKKRYEKLNNKINLVNNDIFYLKNNYNTVLFEKLSEQKIDKSIIEGNLNSSNIKEKYNNLNKNLEKLIQEKEELINSFKEEKIVKELLSFIEINKKSILNDIEIAEKNYSIKYEIVVLIFLIPLLIIFFYLMKNYLKKEKYLLYLIFKNLIIVTLIPTFISLVNLIDIFIPKIFIEKVLMFFYSLEIPFIVYYIVIALFIILFIFIIIKLQKKFREENEKLKNNNITKIDSFNKNLCNKCGNRVDYNFMNYCPCCQNQLKIKCNNCHTNSIKGLDYCSNCGAEIKE